MTDPAVELRKVCVDVPGTRILHPIDWQLAVGQRAVILGPNGSGKSTLLKVITAYGHVSSGTVKVLGHTLGETEVHRLRRQMGIVDPSLTRLLERGMTARQLVATGFFGHLTHFFDRPSPAQLQAAESVLLDVGLRHHVDQTFATLSSGQQSRVWLARALVHRPQLLVLDEPTADLDLVARETFLATLHALCEAAPDLTVLFVTHHLEDLLPDVDQVILLSEGRSVAQGSPTRVLTDSQLSCAFGCEVKVTHDAGHWQWSVPRHVWPELLTPRN